MNPARIRLCVFALFSSAAVFGATSFAAAADPLDVVEKSSEAWLQTRLEAARVESSWATERNLLESTLKAYESRATEGEEKRDLAKAKSSKDREEIETLRTRAQAVQGDVQQFEVRAKALGAALVQLRPALPPRLSAGLEFAYRSLSNPTLAPGERMQIAMTILSRCQQFDRAITAGEDILEVEPGQKPRAVDVIYWGLSHAYALDRHAGKAWLGRPSERGWAWEPKPDIVPQVEQLVSIYNGKEDPDFVLVPARVHQAHVSSSTGSAR